MSTTSTVDQKSEYEHRKGYINNEFSSLVGKQIVKVRPLTPKECELLYWEWDHNSDAMVIIFSDDSCIIPMADPEGNGAGFLQLADLGASQ